MKIAVVGLWHLGTVTAACLADAGFEVVGLDNSEKTIADLNGGKLPVNEPGLGEIMHRVTGAKKLNAVADERVVAVQTSSKATLNFSSDYSKASDCDIVWITFDTPVDEDDNADVAFVEQEILKLVKHLKPGAVFVISSQMPVGTTAKLREQISALRPKVEFGYAYSPENLRLGKAIEVFTKPDRVVVGFDTEKTKQTITKLLKPFSDNIIWMSIESAEMTKHALNAFLAVSVSYINEIAAICEQVGADAKEVEIGLKSEQRIGPKAYLSPGAAFAGGTLARDVAFLVKTASEKGRSVPLLQSVRPSNEEHKRWAQHRLVNQLKSLKGQTVAVLGLAYKKGTDTLRRSASVELCSWLASQGATVQAHDPWIRTLPDELKKTINLKDTVQDALKDARALVIATEWPEFRKLEPAEVKELMKQPFVLDANGFLRDKLAQQAEIHYLSVGKP